MSYFFKTKNKITPIITKAPIPPIPNPMLETPLVAAEIVGAKVPSTLSPRIIRTGIFSVKNLGNGCVADIISIRRGLT